MVFAVRMNNSDKTKAEMKTKNIPTLDELIEFIKREGKDSPLVKEMNAKLKAAVEKMTTSERICDAHTS